MADYSGYQSYREPDQDQPAPAQLQGGEDRTGDTQGEASPEFPYSDVEGLKRELAQHQRDLEAVQERVELMRHESKAEAEAIRRDGEANAREIIRKATAEADMVELRAQVRAEETRAREVARLWSRLDAAMASTGKRGQADSVSEVISPPIPEAMPEAVDMAEGNAGEEANQTWVREAEPEAGQQPTPGPDEPTTAEHVVDEAAESGRDGQEEAEHAPEPMGASQPPAAEVRRYRVRGPLSFGSMVAIEQAAGRIPGVLSAKVSPSPDGGAVLVVSSQDPSSTEIEIRQIPHLSWQLEEL